MSEHDDERLRAVRVLQRAGLLSDEVDPVEVAAVEIAKAMLHGHCSRGNRPHQSSFISIDVASIAFGVAVNIHELAGRRLIKLAGGADEE